MYATTSTNNNINRHNGNCFSNEIYDLFLDNISLPNNLLRNYDDNNGHDDNDFTAYYSKTKKR